MFEITHTLNDTLIHELIKTYQQETVLTWLALDVKLKHHTHNCHEIES